MATQFPKTPSFSGFNAPTRTECDVCDLEVIQGEVPKDLNGTFYRMGAEPQFPPMYGDDIPLNGDGMVGMFRFENGTVDFRCRYVRTEKFMAERAARRALFGVYRNPFTDHPSVHGKSRGTANTNIVWHARRLFALKEDSRPIEIDPHTLETKGDWTFNGKLTSPTFTAHPKIDPETGEMLFFGYEARGEATPDIAFYVADSRGLIVREEWFAAPYPSMVHDFGVTREHIVFAISPLVADLERMKKGGAHFAWDDTRDTFVGVFPRKGSVKDMRWFRTPTCFSSHVMNAFTAGDKVHFDTPAAEIVVFPFFPMASGKPWDPQRSQPHLQRWSFDLSSSKEDFEKKTLSDVTGEFPRLDDRRAMSAYRHGWMVSHFIGGDNRPSSITGRAFNALAHIDTATGVTRQYYTGDGYATQEPCFVPKPNSKEEGDGYVIALVNQLVEMRNEFVILSAKNLDAGPIAILKLPIRLRNGLHGNWVAAEDLP